MFDYIILYPYVNRNNKKYEQKITAQG